MTTLLDIWQSGLRSEKEEHEIATVLANLALTPFINNASFGWGHMIGLNREFPTFKGCNAVFFSGPFTKKGWGFIKTSEGLVKILNVVPLTEAERARARSMNPIDFLQSLMEELDIFEGRDRGSE